MYSNVLIKEQVEYFFLRKCPKSTVPYINLDEHIKLRGALFGVYQSKQFPARVNTHTHPTHMREREKFNFAQCILPPKFENMAVVNCKLQLLISETQ